MPLLGRRDGEQDSVPGFDPIREEYVRLDLDRWLKKHRVLKKAREHGSSNLPPSAASDLDSTELEIVDWINHRGRKCRQDVVRHLSGFERELARMENDQELIVQKHKVDQIEKNSEIELERKTNEGRNALIGLAQEVATGRRDFEKFRTRSSLTRLPDYGNRCAALIFISVCFVVEVVLNASLLMDVNPFGLMGASMQMSLISAVNIWIGGLLMGGLLRRKNHMDLWPRTLSWLGIVLTTAVIAGFNLFVGHFRDSVQKVMDDQGADVLQMGSDALQQVTGDPLGLDSFQTVLLVLLGISCFGIASWKWLQRDDPYPDYGQRDRQLKRIETDYVKHYDEVVDDLTKIFRDFESRMEDLRHQLEIRQSQWKEICVRGTRLVKEYTVNLQQYQHDLDYLLKAYRTENERVRMNPAPPHFAQQLKVDAAILSPPSFTPSAEVSLQSVMDQVHAAITRLQVRFQDSCRRFRPLAEIGSHGAAGDPTE